MKSLRSIYPRSIYPRSISPGAKIGFICPGGGLEDSEGIKAKEKLDRAVGYLERAGLGVKPGKFLLQSSSTSPFGYLSGGDDERTSDYFRMIEDKSVDAIFALRGGYGSIGLAPAIQANSSTIRDNAKLVCGFSDVTALLAAQWKHARLVGMHSPMLGAYFFDSPDHLANERVESNFFYTLSNDNFQINYPFSQEDIIREGQALGRIYPFNLSTLCSLIGSDHLPDMHNGILLIEDVGEDLYKIDRMLTQLKNANILDSLSGIVLGHFSLEGKPLDSQALKTLLKNKVSKNIPIVQNLPVGHSHENYTVPFGLPVLLDTNNRTICGIS